MPSPRNAQPEPNTLTAPEIAIALRACIAARQPVCIHGAVGIGKSQVVNQTIASIADATWQLEPTSRRDPTDYSGVPMPDSTTRTTVWCEPAFYANARDAANSHPLAPHVIFWDEFNRAPPSVQNATLNIILENRSGDYILPPNVTHILAVNDAADSSATTTMSEAARNRVVHLYQRSDAPTWLHWSKGGTRTDLAAIAGTVAYTPPPFAFDANYRDTATGNVKPEIITYISNHPDALHDFDRNADAFPTPRSWEFLSRLLNPNLPPNIERALCTGAVGVPHGTQFYAHVALFRTLAGRFDIPRIIAAPTTEPIPTDISALYAVASGLSRTMNATNAPAILTYLARLPGEFSAFAVLSAIARTTPPNDPNGSPLHSVGPINAWKLAHQDMF